MKLLCILEFICRQSKKTAFSRTPYVEGILSALLVGSRQLKADHLAPDDCPVQKLNGDPLEVFLLPADTADPVANPCLFCFTRPYGYPVYIMGVWENGWTQLFSPDIPGGVGFVRTEQLHAEPSGPLG